MSTHEHLEHAEHATHHAGNTFDRRVALTIAIVAAVVAAVGMFTHRKHNDTLIYSNLKGQQDVEKVQLEGQETNIWAQYQSKRLRQEMQKLAALTLRVQPVTPEGEKERDEAVAKLNADVDRYTKELKDLQADAAAKKGDIEKAGKKAEATHHKAEHAHHQASYLDYAHLAAELGLVLCSIAVLTKKKPFWLVGIIVTVVGIGTAGYAFTLKDHHAADHGTPAATTGR